MEPESKFGKEHFLQIPMDDKPLFIPLYELTKNVFIMPFIDTYAQLQILLKKWLKENRGKKQGDLVSLIKSITPSGNREFTESVIYPKFNYKEMSPELQELCGEREEIIEINPK